MVEARRATSSLHRATEEVAGRKARPIGGVCAANSREIENGAVEKTRTSTGFTPQRPQRCASTNSATTALLRNRAPEGALQPLLYQTLEWFTRALFAAPNLSALQGGLFLCAAMHMFDFDGDHIALEHYLHIGNRHAIGK